MYAESKVIDLTWRGQDKKVHMYSELASLLLLFNHPKGIWRGLSNGRGVGVLGC